MRINQLQTLCWAGNVLVLAGMAWVGYHFVGAVQKQRERVEHDWPGSDAPPPDLAAPWPPGAAAFVHVWKTPIDGPVPPPPAPPVPPEKRKEDPWGDFKATLKFQSVLEFASTPSATTITLEHAAKTNAYRPGAFIAPDWQVVGYRERPAEGDNSAAHVVTFRYLKDKSTHEFVVDQPVPEAIKNGPVKWGPAFLDPISEGLVSLTKLERQVYNVVGDDAFHIPHEEMWWWRSFGDQGFEAAGATAQPGNDTVAAGVLFTRDLHAHPTLRLDRGVLAGDLVVAVNGKPVREPAEVLRYFQGLVEDVRAFALTVRKDGQERTVRFVLDPGPAELQQDDS